MIGFIICATLGIALLFILTCLWLNHIDKKVYKLDERVKKIEQENEKTN